VRLRVIFFANLAVYTSEGGGAGRPVTDAASLPFKTPSAVVEIVFVIRRDGEMA